MFFCGAREINFHSNRLQNPKWPLGGPKMANGPGKVSTLGYLGTPINFRKISFLIQALLPREKVTAEKKKEEENGGRKRKRLMRIVATMSLPAVDRPNADRWNAVRSRQ